MQTRQKKNRAAKLIDEQYNILFQKPKKTVEENVEQPVAETVQETLMGEESEIVGFLSYDEVNEKNLARNMVNFCENENDDNVDRDGSETLSADDYSLESDHV